MLPDRVSNPEPLTYESDALPIALRGPASTCLRESQMDTHKYDRVSLNINNNLGNEVF